MYLAVGFGYPSANGFFAAFLIISSIFALKSIEETESAIRRADTTNYAIYRQGRYANQIHAQVRELLEPKFHQKRRGNRKGYLFFFGGACLTKVEPLIRFI